MDYYNRMEGFAEPSATSLFHIDVWKRLFVLGKKIGRLSE